MSSINLDDQMRRSGHCGFGAISFISSVVREWIVQIIDGMCEQNIENKDLELRPPHTLMPFKYSIIYVPIRNSWPASGCPANNLYYGRRGVISFHEMHNLDVYRHLLSCLQSQTSIAQK